MKSKSRIIFDTTQLVHWQGRLSGIPRVIHEMAIRYQKFPNVTFVTWDKYSDEYIIIDLQKSLRDRGKQIHYQAVGSTRSSSPGNRSKTPLMVEVKNKAKIVAKKLHLEKYAQAAWRRARGANEHGLPAGHQFVEFQPGDSLVVLWGEMQYDHFAEKLVSLQKKGVRLVQMVHDMIPLLVPQFNGHSTEIMTSYCRKVLPITDTIIVNSRSTKQDVTKWLKQNQLNVPRFHTIRLGDDFSVNKVEKPVAPELSDLKKMNFVLSVGTVEARKNHSVLYYAYKLAAVRGISLPQLVIVGGKGYRTENIIDIINNDPEVNQKIILAHNISDTTLAWLYQNARYTVYPSFYEGWGIPIAESIANGVPCLASNTSSMTEIAGTLIDYFTPASSDECLAGMQKLNDPEYNKAARKKIAGYTPTTWSDTFSQLDEAVSRS